jgi:hypothetical protein
VVPVMPGEGPASTTFFAYDREAVALCDSIKPHR